MPIDYKALGDEQFRRDHGVGMSYVAGAMVKGIASADMVIRLARARILGFFGAGGLTPNEVAGAIDRIRGALLSGESFGVNFLHNMLIPRQEEDLVDLFLAREVRRVEAAAFVQVTPALVRYRLTGLEADSDGAPQPVNRVLAKVSHPRVAEQFLAPPAPAIVGDLLASGRIDPEAARLAMRLPLADDVCAEADSGGHTDRRVALALLPQMLRARDEAQARHGLPRRVRVGLAGGLGAPEAIAAAFVMGADFVLTGSINQCTVEAGTSDAVKDLLARADVQDTDMAPAGDLFEIGAKVQVLKRGTLFVGRANRLYDLYQRHGGLDELAPEIRHELESRYFGRSIEAVWEETAQYYRRAAPAELAAAERNPKKRMGMVFRWYFVHSNRLAQAGRREDAADFQIHCGPAMGSLNRWLKGTPLEDWRERHADDLALRLMRGAAEVLEQRFASLARGGSSAEGAT